MSNSPISTLPTEILCKIYEFAADYSVVISLAQTARIFHQTWQQNTTSICQAITPRILTNLAAAYKLADAQENAVKQSIFSIEINHFSIHGTKQLIRNARCASAATTEWIQFCNIHHYFDRELLDDPFMRTSEISRFQHAFYSLWTIGVLAASPQSQDQATVILEACSLQQLYTLKEFREWATNCNENEFGSTDLDLKDNTWKASCEMVRQWWDSKGVVEPFVCPHTSPMGWFAFFDDTQAYLDLIRVR